MNWTTVSVIQTMVWKPNFPQLDTFLPFRYHTSLVLKFQSTTHRSLMVKACDSWIPPNPNSNKVTLSFDKLNNTNVCTSNTQSTYERLFPGFLIEVCFCFSHNYLLVKIIFFHQKEEKRKKDEKWEKKNNVKNICNDFHIIKGGDIFK